MINTKVAQLASVCIRLCIVGSTSRSGASRANHPDRQRQPLQLCPVIHVDGIIRRIALFGIFASNDNAFVNELLESETGWPRSRTVVNLRIRGALLLRLPRGWGKFGQERAPTERQASNPIVSHSNALFGNNAPKTATA
jgi:hypothetical protein